MQYESCLAGLSDEELLDCLSSLLGESRRAEADLVAHIGEVDVRRLYARQASPSMFAYCVDILHLSEAEAYLRIAAARAAREHPLILDMLAAGQLHLSGIAKLVPHLTPENARGLLDRAAYRSKRQIEELIAEISPRPDVPTIVRKLPEKRKLPEEPKSAWELAPSEGSDPAPRLRPDGVGSSVTSAPGPAIEPLAPARYKVQFTASAELREKLERLQRLMQVPTGDLAEVIDRLVTEKLERLERKRFGVAKGPRKGVAQGSLRRRARYIPAPIRRAVYARDGGRCRYTDGQGRQCQERDRLEYHHRYPHGLGGDESLRNLSLLCPAHNQYLAEHDYGRAKMAGHRALARSVSMKRTI
jgi:hypothetical protein